MNVASIFFGTIFTAAGFLMATGRLHVHLRAWKALSEEEQKKVDIEGLCLNVGEVIALCGLIFLMNGCIPGFSDHLFIWSALAWFVMAGFDVWYIVKSRRYEK